jgi:hypothetical protein
MIVFIDKIERETVSEMGGEVCRSEQCCQETPWGL